MKTPLHLLTACFLLLLDIGAAVAQGALERSKRDEVVVMSDDDPAMRTAFAKARAGLDGFLALLDKPAPDTRLYSVKIAIRDGNVNEFFWLTDLTRNGDRFLGRLNNTPRSVKTVHEGQMLTFSREEIRDWMYVDDARQRMVGNFTLCALLTKESPKSAADMKRATGLVCD